MRASARQTAKSLTRLRTASSSARTIAACSAAAPPPRSTNWPVPRICSASDRRAGAGAAASGPKRTAPRHNSSAISRPLSTHHRPAAHPGEREQARIFVLRQEVDLVAARHLRGVHQQPGMIAIEEPARAERHRVDDGDAAAAHSHAHGVHAALSLRSAHSTGLLVRSISRSPTVHSVRRGIGAGRP